MQISITLTAGFLKKSYAKRIFRSWWKFLIAFAMITVSVVADLRSGQFGPLSAFGVSAVGFCVLIYGLAWFRQLKALNDWLKKQGSAPVTYTISAEAVESTSEVGSAKLKWDAFSRLTISDLDVLLFFQRSGALTLPTQQVPQEALEFLKQQFLTHGKKVEDKRKRG
jgi:hypothetical protein